MASTNRRADQPKAYGRSKVSNGNALFPADTTLSWGRRLRDIISLHTADLGGPDFISAAEASIIRRVATETVEMELLELKFAKHGKGAASEDLDLYARISNSLRRHLETIGLKRVSRDITPTLSEYLMQRVDDDEAGTAEDPEADNRSP
jgi:hypothetical protein